MKPLLPSISGEISDTIRPTGKTPVKGLAIRNSGLA